MQGKKPVESDAATKAAFKKFEKENNIVEEEFYSYNTKEYDELMNKRPWKSKYISF